VTSGERLAWLVAAGGAAAFVVVAVFTALHDTPPQIARWKPVVWEITGGLAALLCFFIPRLAVRAAAPGQARWPRLLLVHAPATVIFSAAHISLFILMRMAVYAAVGERYSFDFNVGELLYEYRKGLLAYGAAVATFWLIPLAMTRGRPAAEPLAAAAESAPLYVIRDGARLLRTPREAILAVRSAGNYVEFALADGRMPMARATLAGVETELAPFGFLRIHRSWLVNVAHVRAVVADGSGDHTVTLSNGAEAPLSRRYPAALSRLRGDPPN
jgi:hypothetical protein